MSPLARSLPRPGRVVTGSTQFHSTREPGTPPAIDSDGTSVDQGAAAGDPGGDRVDADRFLVQVHDAVAQPGGREGGHEAVAPEDAGGVRRAPSPQLADVLAASGRTGPSPGSRRRGRPRRRLRARPRSDDLHLVAQGAQRLGEGRAA